MDEGDLYLVKTEYPVQQILSEWPLRTEKQPHDSQMKEDRIKELYMSLIIQSVWFSNNDDRN